jgi:hypothetical protein
MKAIKNYTAADFEAYHAGTMPAIEMHALEKEALQDPFLADALEGYVYTSTAHADVETLKQTINKKTKRVFILSPFANKSWLRIAAVFIFIGLAAYLFFTVNTKSTETSLATNKTETIITTPEKGNVPAADSVVLDETSPSGNYIAPEIKSETVSNTLSKKEKTISILPQSAEKEFLFNDNKQVAPAPVAQNKWADKYADGTLADSIKEDIASASKKYLLSGRVVDDKGEPVAYASVTNKIKNIGVSTDTSGKFYFNSNDSVATLFASSVGYQPKGFTITKDENPVVSISKNNAELSEVVVTGYGNAKRSKSISASADHAAVTETEMAKMKEAVNISKALNGKVSGIIVKQRTHIVSATLTGEKTLSPELKNYLINNPVPFFDAEGKKLKGSVTLAWVFDKNKRPADIMVVRSNCIPCEKEAIKLLMFAPVVPNASVKGNNIVLKF